MTHKDIKTKFMIEYDKANVTSSYPSLTEYEIATLLDKAYLALIAQKVTGNNLRKSTLEADVKGISDIQNLITGLSITIYPLDNGFANNVYIGTIPGDFLYYVSGNVYVDVTKHSGWMNNVDYNVEELNALDELSPIREVPVKLVSHDTAQKFLSTAYNMPVIKTNVAYIEENQIFVIVDPVVGIYRERILPQQRMHGILKLSYVLKPLMFVDGDTVDFSDDTEIELDDVTTEELISLAISYALENVESSRLNAHLGIRGFES